MRVLRRFCVPGSLDGKDSVTIPPELISKGSIPSQQPPLGNYLCAKGLLRPKGQLAQRRNGPLLRHLDQVPNQHLGDNFFGRLGKMV